MMRSLWTASSGMIAQQMNVDVISNNLANVSTVGYKKNRLEFKDALYDTLSRAYTINGTGKPVSLQVGYGCIPVATVKNYSIGNLEKTDNMYDLAIQGDGFFTVSGPNSQILFTRDGGFKMALNPDGTRGLKTTDGYSVLDSNGQPINFDATVNQVYIGTDGAISYTDNTSINVTSTGLTLGVVKFVNEQGLESVGKNFLTQTSVSGNPVPNANLGTNSIINQGYLENSNVQVVEEMVKLIVAQRAYEVNSKAIQSSDEMLGLANNLRRG